MCLWASLYRWSLFACLKIDILVLKWSKLAKIRSKLIRMSTKKFFTKKLNIFMIFHDCVTIFSILADFCQFPMSFFHFGRILYVYGQSYRIFLHFPIFLSIYYHFVELLMFFDWFFLIYCPLLLNFCIFWSCCLIIIQFLLVFRYFCIHVNCIRDARQGITGYNHCSELPITFSKKISSDFWPILGARKTPIKLLVA